MLHRDVPPNLSVSVAGIGPAIRAQASSLKLAFVVVLSVVMATLLLALSASGVDAAVQCHKYAATNGSDKAPGTSSAPYRTAQKLADSLSSGQVGCLLGGNYAERDKNVNIKRPGITLRGVPGATASINARVNVAEGANGVTLTGLKLAGASGFVNVLVRADRARLIDNNITNGHRHSSCVLVGSRYGKDAVVATGTVISDNHIHNCGRLPRTNHDHGIYVSAARDTRILDNVVYDNADRGIQLYPDGDGSLIQGNTIKGNGQGVIISGADRHVSSSNTVANNVIVNSRVGWNVTSSWNQTRKVGRYNVVRNNCVWALKPNSFHGQNGGINPKSRGLKAFDNRISAQCV